MVDYQSFLSTIAVPGLGNGRSSVLEVSMSYCRKGGVGMGEEDLWLLLFRWITRVLEVSPSLRVEYH